jgi:hypothetical protein
VVVADGQLADLAAGSVPIPVAVSGRVVDVILEINQGTGDARIDELFVVHAQVSD